VNWVGPTDLIGGGMVSQPHRKLPPQIPLSLAPDAAARLALLVERYRAAKEDRVLQFAIRRFNLSYDERTVR
jgi:hypothetical protein